MEYPEFERMDRARREIRSMAVVLLDSLNADYTISNLELVEDNLFDAAEVIINAAAEGVVSDQYAPDGGNGPVMPEGSVMPEGARRRVTPPDEQAILGR